MSDTVIVVGYHAKCIDGFTSAWVVRNFAMGRGHEVIAIPLAYGDQESMEELASTLDMLASDGMTPNVELYIVDFSLPAAEMELYMSECTNLSKIVVIDHHATAIRQYTPEIREQLEMSNIFLHLDTAHSGAYLTYKYFFPDIPEVPIMIQYVSDYDTWQKKLAHVDDINMVLRTTRKSFAEWDLLADSMSHSTNFWHIADAGRAMRKYHLHLCEEFLQYATTIELAGEKGLVVNCPSHFANELGELLAKQSGTFGATWYQDGKSAKFSLRSTPEGTDVSKLAEKFGGGGHRGAAGIVLSNPTQDLFPDDDSATGVIIWHS